MIPVYYNFELIFKGLTIVLIDYQVIGEIWEKSNIAKKKSYRASNVESDENTAFKGTLQQFIIEHP